MRYSESYRLISDRVAFLSALESQMIFGMQFIFLSFFFFFGSLQDLSSLTRDRTWAHGREMAKS